MLGFLQQHARAYRFHFGLQRIDEVAESLERQGAPYAHALLSDAERQQYPEAAWVKRRTEWLAGRMAAKRAMARLQSVADWHVLAQTVSVLNDSARAPYLAEHPDLRLSLSHSHEWAVAVVSEGAIGIDLEKIEPRPGALARYFCSREEQLFLESERPLPCERDVDLTLLWCRKEAVAKYLRLGGQLPFADINALPNDLFLPDLCPDRISLHSAQWQGYGIALALTEDAPNGSGRVA